MTQTALAEKGIADTRRELTPEMVDSIMDEIIAQYKEDERPWIIGFSGGKDSTTLLQMFFNIPSMAEDSRTPRRE